LTGAQAPPEHAGRFDAPHPPQHRRRREADLLRKLQVGEPTVALQKVQDAMVGPIEVDVWH
jgi:hypothetical protein